ncbi:MULTISPECIES: signal peptidase I [Glycomyces]|uniref:Signal peptidase I n=2 Tax=Glycomyces TaxID=58113 RepID=A0A9X3PUD2_9ACTN|nr:signal peptidase I [Glycomyces lechevalierae]MDA1385793.1 signal peptidase I [Glycomyces lechevalierae]MDR7339913.1 signal peptidase I [Glycomyces lechevalierae]
MSPGTPGGAKGPRRIGWDRLPGPGGPDAPPPAAPPPPGAPPPGSAAPSHGPAAPPPGPAAPPPGPVAGTGRGGTDQTHRLRDDPDATRTFRRPEGPSGPQDRVAAERERASAAVERASGAHDQVDPQPSGKHKGGKGAESRLSQPHKRQYLSLWVELPLLLVIAFSAAVLLRTFAVQPFYIPSGSMEQTLQEGDKVLVLKLTSTLRTPQRGEVVVFRGTDSWDPEYRPATGDDGAFSTFTTGVLDLIGLAKPDEKDFIKRVVAVGGDTVSCCDADGNVVVNGVSLHEEAYVYENSPLEIEPGVCGARRFEELTVPEGEVWVMGDHRGDSSDSRCSGTVPVENIIGRAIALVWPTDRARELEIPETFDALDGTTGSASDEGEPSAAGTVGDGVPAAWNTAWQQPPSLPGTVMLAPGAGARARRLGP